MFKSKGTTPSEKLLAEIAERTFLRLWSYPNVFRDQGRASESSDGKEICDLLVVSGNHLIIFSDKSCEISKLPDLNLAWSRWYDHAIEKSAKQIFGAERWLKKHPQRVFVDRQCKHPLPFMLPAPNFWQVHRIVVAIGARERCAKEVGGSGSLQICLNVVSGSQSGSERSSRMRHRASYHRPFEVGWVNPKQGFVHILDEFTLRTLLEELDTITDLVDYLNEKESIVQSGILEYASGEEELLWEYLREGDKKRSRSFDRRSTLQIKGRNWQRWASDPLYITNKHSEKFSRGFWDNLINLFTDKVLKNDILPGKEYQLSEIESCLRVMASESRLARRALTHAFLERMLDSAQKLRTWRMMFFNHDARVGYVFLFYRSTDYEDFEEYRRDRRDWLTGLLTIYAAHNPHLKKLIGIATEAGCTPRTYELGLCVPKDARISLNEEVRRLQAALGVKDEEINAKFGRESEFVPK